MTLTAQDSQQESPYLLPAIYIDSDHPDVQALAKQALEHCSESPVERAKALFHFVRDHYPYNPYSFKPDQELFKASAVLGAKESFCIPKAILLAALARAAGIPSRLGFSDVVNHLASKRLLEMLKTDVFAFHGYTEMLLDGQWLKATPAFDARLCERFGVAAIDFDGQNDAIFHAFDKEGRSFMKYIHDYGRFEDFPYDLMLDSFKRHYPHWFQEHDQPGFEGQLAQEEPA